VFFIEVRSLFVPIGWLVEHAAPLALFALRENTLKVHKYLCFCHKTVINARTIQ